MQHVNVGTTMKYYVEIPADDLGMCFDETSEKRAGQGVRVLRPAGPIVELAEWDTSPSDTGRRPELCTRTLAGFATR